MLEHEPRVALQQREVPPPERRFLLRRREELARARQELLGRGSLLLGVVEGEDQLGQRLQPAVAQRILDELEELGVRERAVDPLDVSALGGEHRVVEGQVCAVVPVGLLIAIGDLQVMPPMWVHFYGVGVSALVAAAAATVLTVAGAREGDTRTVVVGGGFALMATLLGVHGLATPGVLLGMNGLIAVTGAATLPVGAPVLRLSSLPPFTSRFALRRVLAWGGVLAAGILLLSLLGALVPALVPGVPPP